MAPMKGDAIPLFEFSPVTTEVVKGKLHLAVWQSEEEFLATLENLPQDIHELHLRILRSRQSQEEATYERIVTYEKLYLTGRPFWKELRCASSLVDYHRRYCLATGDALADLQLLVRWFDRPTFLLVGAEELRRLIRAAESCFSGRHNEPRRRQMIKEIFDHYTASYPRFSLLEFWGVVEQVRAKHTPKPQAATPTINPAGGTFIGEVAVTLQTTTDRAEIRYTTDGSEPSVNSPRYRNPFTLKANATVKARAFNGGMKDSGLASAQFTVASPPPPPPKPKVTIHTKPQAATPTINPAGGTFIGEVAVTLQTTTDRAEIRYTTDGSEPSVNSPRYRNPFTLKANATVKARAFNGGMKDSGLASAQFTVASADLHRRRQEFQKRLAKSGDIGRMLVEVTTSYKQYLYRHQQIIRKSNAAGLLPQLQQECPYPIPLFWELMGESAEE